MDVWVSLTQASYVHVQARILAHHLGRTRHTTKQLHLRASGLQTFLPATVLLSAMTEQSIFKDVPFSGPGRAARMSQMSLHFQLRWLT